MPVSIAAVFVSATSRDLGSYRREARDALLTGGILPIVQDHFPPDYRTLCDLLRDQIRKCDAVFCLVGFAFGAAPRDFPHRSYTQLEYDIARELDKPVFRFLATDRCVLDASPIDGPAERDLQAAYRQGILDGAEKWEAFGSTDELRQRIAEAVPVVFSLVAERDPANCGPAGEQGEAFLRGVADQCAWIDLPSPGGGPLPIDRLWVWPEADYDPPLADETPGAEPVGPPTREPSRRERLTPDALLSAGRVVLFGEAGAGKTTLLRFLARVVLGAAGGVPPPVSGRLVPLTVALGEYDRYCDQCRPLGLLDYLPEAARLHGLRLPAEWLADQARDGACLFLLDGLDEVAHPLRRQGVRNRIAALAREYPRCRIVVTAKPAGYRETPFRPEDGFRHFALCPFTPEAVQEFAQRWFGPAEPAAWELVREVDRSPSNRELARNPLLLTLLALSHRSGGGLPAHLFDLYHGAVRAILSRQPTSDLTAGQVEDLLQTVAFALASDGAGVLPQAALEAALLRHLTEPRRGGSAEFVARRTVEQFLALTGERTGLLTRRRRADGRLGDVFAFRHRAFGDYFAGRELARLWQAGELPVAEYTRRSRWRGALALAAPALSEEEADRFVRRILAARSPFEGLLHRDLLLAAGCLAAGANLADETVARIFADLEQAWSTPIGPLNESIATALAALRGTQHAAEAARLAERRLGHDLAAVRGSAARALAGLGATGRPRLVQALIDLAAEGGEGAVAAGDALAEAARTADPASVNLLLSGLRLVPAVRFAVARGLGGVGPGAPGLAVPDALLDRLGDPSPYVRGAVVASLARLGLTRPAVVDRLLGWLGGAGERSGAAQALGRLWAAGCGPARAGLLAAADADDSAVRALALEGLAEAAPPLDGPVVAVLLRRLVDRDWAVRAAATRAMTARKPAATEPGVALLLDHLAHPHWAVRTASVRCLAGLGLPATPAVVAGLVARLEDVEADVRGAAAAALGGLVGLPIRSDAIDALVARLADEEWVVRAATAESLGALSSALDDRGIAALSFRLRDDQADVRRAAAEALGRTPFDRSAPAVRAVCRLVLDPDPTVRLAAVEALGGLSRATVQVLSSLERGAADPEWDVRRAVVVALGRLGQAGSGDALASLLLYCEAEVEPELRRAAVEALAGCSTHDANIPAQLAVFIDDADPGVRCAAAAGLGRAAEVPLEEALAALLRCLDDPAPTVRVAACDALVRIGPTTATLDVLEKLAALAARKSDGVGRDGAAAIAFAALASLLEDVGPA